MFQLFHKVGGKTFLFVGLLTILFASFLFHSPMTVHANALTSNGWAGYEARGTRGTYTEVNTYFIVPALAPIVGTSVAIWAGVGSRIGATYPRELVQAGIAAFVDASTGIQVNKAFWEVYGDGTTNTEQYFPQSVLSVQTGDLIWVYVTSNLDNSGQDYFIVEDTTTGKSASTTLKDIHAITDGTAAECIAEDHLNVLTLSPKPLANFGTILFSSCRVYGQSKPHQGWLSIGNEQYNKLDMVRGSTTLATTSELLSGTYPGDGNSFTITWHNLGL